MIVVFYSMRSEKTDKQPHAVECGRVELVRGEIVITPPPFDTQLREMCKQRKRAKLDPKDGAAFLRKLPQAFNGTYFYAVQEKP